MIDGELLARGRTAEVYAWGQGQILKLYLAGFPVADIEREYRISRLVHEHGVATPLAMECLEIDERYGVVFARVTGPTMLHMMVSQPNLVPGMARKLAELHHQVHQIRVTGLPARKDALLRDLQVVPYLNENERAAILDRLQGLPDGDRLCHGDFHPDNVLVSDGSPTVIDWMTGSSGCPASDLVRSCVTFLTASPPPGAPKAVGEMIASLKQTLYREYLHRTLDLSGVSLVELEQWALPVAAARLNEGLPEVEKELLLAMVRRGLAGEKVLDEI